MEKLLNDLNELGLPIIYNYFHGFYYFLKPSDYEIDKEFDRYIKFSIKDFGFLVLSFYDVVLNEVNSPANLIVNTKKCYAIVQKETGGHLGYIYWPGPG
ncbi:MAG: hypothetical protein GXY91_10140 [Clostridia bacterium]|nr:hypothetical protein [Clostridia bacterium]